MYSTGWTFIFLIAIIPIASPSTAEQVRRRHPKFPEMKQPKDPNRLIRLAGFRTFGLGYTWLEVKVVERKEDSAMSDRRKHKLAPWSRDRGIRTVGVLTSGGDAPGMNAAIRAVVREGLHQEYKMLGCRRGFHGLCQGDIIELGDRSVSGRLQHGGTFLMTARSQAFNSPEGVQKAFEMCQAFNMDALVVIGGDGSLRGALDLARLGLPVVGIPSTIDNDVGCSGYAIGYDTALNTAMEAIDKLRDTASSHERCSCIEVMGRKTGYIALTCLWGEIDPK